MQAITRLDDIPAQMVELVRQRGKPIGLVSAEVADAPKAALSLGKAGKRGQCGRELTDFAQIDVNALDLTCHRGGEGTGAVRDARPHRAQEVPQGVARLGRVGWPVRDGDRTLGDQSGSKEGRRVGEIRLDRAIHGKNRRRGHAPSHRILPLNLDAMLSEHRDGHVDVRLAGNRLAHMVNGQAGVEAGTHQQQGGDELA